MKAALECGPCVIRQALDAARLATDDETIHEQVVLDALKMVAESGFDKTPVHISQPIYARVRELSGCDDPFREVKELSNRFAMNLLPEMEDLVEKSDRPFDTAVRLAIAGNIIDFGVMNATKLDYVHETIDHALEALLDNAMVRAMQRAIHDARDILYLADNAGEIVFDRLLLGRMPLDKVTVVVKGGPIINDVTMDDARYAGLTEMVSVISSGTTCAGTVLEDCTDEFRQRFAETDLVVAKGQGNYEALEEVDKPIYFMLKAKCSVIASSLNCRVGDIVITSTPAARASAAGVGT